MNFRFSNHARKEVRRRGIPQALVEMVLAEPEQKTPEYGTIICYQSRVTIDSRTYLLRVMVEEAKQPPVVVTAYRTSRIEKYWSAP